MPKDEYDIIVIGAGPGGSSAANVASSMGWNVLLLDRFQFPREKVCGDGLTPHGIHLLHQIGVNLEDLRSAGGYEIEEFRIFLDTIQVEKKPFLNDQEKPDPALGITRQALDSLLVNKAISKGAAWYGGFEVYSVTVDMKKQSVSIKGKVEHEMVMVNGRLAIIAAGASARFYRALGSQSLPQFYGVGLRQYFKFVDSPLSSFDLFYEPYLPGGYAWIFPVGSDLLNVGVGVKIGNDRVNLPMALRTFVKENLIAAHILVDAQPIGLPKAAPMRMRMSEKLVDDGLLWVGDAAGLTHPISGQGIPQAIESGLLAAEIATTALQRGDIHQQILYAYDREIRSRFSL